MKQRIRYIKKDNKIISKNEVINKHGSRYIVIIELDTMTYTIRNAASYRNYTGGENINNMNVLKRTIKKHLEHLGVEFETESRNRTFGVCEKGFNQQKALEKRQQEQIKE